MFFISYIFITCIHIYSSIYEISVTFLHMYSLIFYTHVFYKTLFHNCSLPDVASAIIALLHVISLVFSLMVGAGEDNEPNNIEFVLIDIHCDFMETFLSYCMTNDTLHFFVSYISMTCIHIYLYILLCYNCSF